MCGITGVYNPSREFNAPPGVIEKMTEALQHRGPDEHSIHYQENFSYGFRRLSIIDIAGGSQPFFNSDHSITVLCNGEIFNYKELRREMEGRGYVFRSDCDVEVIVPLYEWLGISFVEKLNGQFAISLFDAKCNTLFLIRDHFGICPLMYAVIENTVIFASEAKALLQYPLLERRVNMTALDQIFSFPGMLSPETMFAGIKSIRPGHYMAFSESGQRGKAYWDFDYPVSTVHYEAKDEQRYVEELEGILTDSIRLRLNADVPVGFYLSGGLDSSLIGSLSKKINKGRSYPAFSIQFPDPVNSEIDEQNHQRVMSDFLGCESNVIPFDWSDIEKNLRKAVWHSESALRETYNTCSLALSQKVQSKNIKVILSGEGADEIFGGYPGYRFDLHRSVQQEVYNGEIFQEKQLNKRLWSNENFFYEHNLFELADMKGAIYSDEACAQFSKFNCLNTLAIDTTQLQGRHPFHMRSYLDFKLRLGDHLIADHCDRVCYANSIEGRYPFLDHRIIDFTRTVPPDLMMKNMNEKNLLKKVARNYLPATIIDRQKFGFVAPGSPHLLQNNVAWVNDLLAPDRIKRQGYFNPSTVERLRKKYSQPGFKLNIPFESDLLIIILTFNILLSVFDLPDYSA